MADGGDLRIGEDDPRRARAVGEVLSRHVLAENAGGGDRRLVLGHVGERRAPVEVAHHVQPVAAGHPAVRVDLDVDAHEFEQRRAEPEPARLAVSDNGN